MSAPKVPQPPVPPPDTAPAHALEDLDELDTHIVGQMRRSAPSPSLFVIDGAANY